MLLFKWEAEGCATVTPVLVALAAEGLVRRHGGRVGAFAANPVVVVQRVVDGSRHLDCTTGGRPASVFLSHSLFFSLSLPPAVC